MPVLQSFFLTVPLKAGELALSVGVAAAVFVAVELEKLVLRGRDRGRYRSA